MQRLKELIARFPPACETRRNRVHSDPELAHLARQRAGKAGRAYLVAPPASSATPLAGNAKEFGAMLVAKTERWRKVVEVSSQLKA